MPVTEVSMIYQLSVGYINGSPEKSTSGMNSFSDEVDVRVGEHRDHASFGLCLEADIVGGGRAKPHIHILCNSVEVRGVKAGSENSGEGSEVVCGMTIEWRKGVFLEVVFPAGLMERVSVRVLREFSGAI